MAIDKVTYWKELADYDIDTAICHDEKVAYRPLIIWRYS